MFVKLARRRYKDDRGSFQEDPVWINFDNVVGFEPYNDGTMIYGFGENAFLTVSDSFEEVENKMRSA